MLVTGISKKDEDLLNSFPFTSESSFKVSGLSVSPDLWFGASLYPDVPFEYPLRVDTITLDRVDGDVPAKLTITVVDARGVDILRLSNVLNGQVVAYTDMWAVSVSGKCAGVLSGDHDKLKEFAESAPPVTYQASSDSLMFVPSVCFQVRPSGIRGFSHKGVFSTSVNLVPGVGVNTSDTSVSGSPSGSSGSAEPVRFSLYGEPAAAVIPGVKSINGLATQDISIVAKLGSFVRVVTRPASINILAKKEL